MRFRALYELYMLLYELYNELYNYSYYYIFYINQTVTILHSCTNKWLTMKYLTSTYFAVCIKIQTMHLILLYF